MQPNSQYDFMLNPNQGNRGPIYGGGKKRLALGIAFVVVCLIIVAIVGSIIFSPDNSGNERLVGLEAHQVEIDRIITLGQKNMAAPELKKQLGTYQTSVLSDRRQIVSLLNTRGYTPLEGAVGAERNSKSDSTLNDAVQINNHDDELTDIIETLTDNYYTALKQAQSTAASNRERAILEDALTNVETIFARTN